MTVFRPPADAKRRWLDRLVPWLLALLVLVAAVRAGFASMPLYVDYDAPHAPRAPLAAVLLSGDLGLAAGMGDRIGTRLARAGIPTVGVNTPAYFLTHRSPDDIAGVVEAAARRAIAGRPGARLVLIGQSFGADVLPAGVNRLPPDILARVGLVVLTTPGREVYHGISIGEYFGLTAPDAAGVTEARMIALPLLCIRGHREPDSLCPHLSGRNVREVVLPGGHMLRRDAARLFATMQRAIAHMTKAS